MESHNKEQVVVRRRSTAKVASARESGIWSVGLLCSSVLNTSRPDGCDGQSAGMPKMVRKGVNATASGGHEEEDNKNRIRDSDLSF